MLQNEARKLNHQEVVEEDKRLKLPANWEAKKARLEWELSVDEKKKVKCVILVVLPGTTHFSCLYLWSRCCQQLSTVRFTSYSHRCHGRASWPPLGSSDGPYPTKAQLIYKTWNVQRINPYFMLIKNPFRNVLPEGRTGTEWSCWRSQPMTQNGGRGRRRRRTLIRDLQVGNGVFYKVTFGHLTFDPEDVKHFSYKENHSSICHTLNQPVFVVIMSVVT